MRIIVTGGTGMVGQHIKNSPFFDNYSKDHEFLFISSKVCDLTNKEKVDKLFHHCKIDAIIHLAAKVGGLYKNMNANPQMLIDNLRINMNVLEACNKYNVKRGIFCLSSCVYPQKPSKFPMTEEMIDESPPHDSNEGYSYSKRMIKVLCDHYNKDFGREYICLSPVNLYGPYDNFNLQDSHVIPGLIHKMYNILNSNLKKTSGQNQVEIWGTGKAMRQFLFAGDFAHIILNFLFNPQVKEGLYNICGDEEYSIREVVGKVRDIWNIADEKIYYNDQYSDGIIKKTVCNNKFRQLYPDFKFMKLHDGLFMTCNWFYSSYSHARK
jgi:GDP-L-fucose synthase